MEAAAPHLREVLPDGGQRRREVGRFGDVVESDDADLARRLPAGFVKPAEEAESHLIVGHEDRGHARLGRLVLLGDPGRNYFSAQGLEERARYEIPTSLQLENRGMRETVVWRVLPYP